MLVPLFVFHFWMYCCNMSLSRKLITQFIQNKSSFVKKLYTVTDKNTNDYPLFGTILFNISFHLYIYIYIIINPFTSTSVPAGCYVIASILSHKKQISLDWFLFLSLSDIWCYRVIILSEIYWLPLTVGLFIVLTWLTQSPAHKCCNCAKEETKLSHKIRTP
jgi:hypothetical protein